ncbi:MAG: helix-turn-helix domain-containing protein [Spirochaetia bacterium]|nr:helix-turn-helix domain-containing protein [Spirochaetia bacterium]
MEKIIVLFFCVLFFITGFVHVYFYKKIKNPYYITNFFFLGYTGLYLWMYESGFLINFPYLYGSIFVVYASIGPFIYLAFRKAVEREFFWQNKYLLLFLPALFQWAALLPYYLLDISKQKEKLRVVLKTYLPEVCYIEAANFLLLANYTFFLVFLVVYLAKRISFKDIQKESAQAEVLKILLIWGVVHMFALIFFSVFVTESKIWFIVGHFITTLSVYLFFVFLTLVPYLVKLGVFTKPGDVWNAHVFSKSRLLNVDIEKTEKELQRLFEEEKLYLDEKLELKHIAKKLNLNVYQASELINSRFQKHCNAFINHYRIIEAKKIMRTEKNHNITNICYESGFNSYSSFHEAFKKETGMSPENWRNDNLSERNENNA